MQGCSFPSISDSRRGAAGAPSRPASDLSGAAAICLLAGSLLLSACAGSVQVPAPTAKNVALAERHGEVTTLPTLKLGRKLYISRCSACHSLKTPGFLTPSEWPEMVERMAPDAKVSADQQRAITQYLVSASAAVHDTSGTVSTPAAAPAQAPAAN